MGIGEQGNRRQEEVRIVICSSSITRSFIGSSKLAGRRLFNNGIKKESTVLIAFRPR